MSRIQCASICFIIGLLLAEAITLADDTLLGNLANCCLLGKLVSPRLSLFPLPSRKPTYMAMRLHFCSFVGLIADRPTAVRNWSSQLVHRP